MAAELELELELNSPLSPRREKAGCSSRADLTRTLRDDLAEHDETYEDMFLRVMSPEYDDADESRVLYRHIAACRAHRDSVDPSDNSATAARAHPARSELRNDSDD
mgnify:CR=1 FL=1